MALQVPLAGTAVPLEIAVKNCRREQTDCLTPSLRQELMAFFAAISRAVSSGGGFPPLVLTGATQLYQVFRKANVLDGMFGGLLVGFAQVLALILLGEGLSMSHALKSVLGVTKVVEHNGSSLAHLAILAGVILASATIYTVNDYFHFSLDEVHPSFLTAVVAGIASQMDPCPWGHGLSVKSFFPLLLTLISAYSTSYVLKVFAYVMPVKQVDWITSVWSKGQKLLDLNMFKGYPSPTPLVVLVVASILVRLVTSSKTPITTRPTHARRRHYEDDALSAASALIVGALYSIGLLLARVHSLALSSDNYRFGAFMAAAAITTSVCHKMLSTSFPNSKPLTPIKHNPLTFGEILQGGDTRRHTINLYIGAVLTGVVWSLSGPTLVGPTLAAAAGGRGGYENLIGLIAGLSVGTVFVTAT